MPIPDTTYPFDPSGTQIGNKVTGEQHIITSVNYKDYNVIVPVYAPFFASSITLSYKDINATTVVLTENVDYYLTHWFIAASRACSKPIYGSITLLNETLSGVLTLSYQTLGGAWNIDAAKIAEIMADTINNPRITSWDEVADLPFAFPVIDHPWDLVDMVGASDIVNSLEDIHQAILNSTGGDGSTVALDLQNHIADHNNPHQVSASQIGALTQTAADALYLGKLAKAADTTRFDGRTFVDAKTEILEGTATDSNALGGKTLAEVIALASSTSVDNATKFDNRTFAQATSEILSGQAADSLRFNGMDQADFDEHVDTLIDNNAATHKRTFLPYATAGANVDSWTLLATFTNTPNSDISSQENNVHLLVDTSEFITDAKDSSYEVFVNARDTTPTLEVVSIKMGSNPVAFGVSFDSTSALYSLWVKTKSSRSFINVVSLAGGNINSASAAASVVDTEPLVIDYAATSSEGYVSVEEFRSFMSQLTAKFTALGA